MPLPISNNGKEFPRELTPLEQELIFSLLPERSEIYRRYRERIQGMKVVGLGRRGAGHLVLGEHRPQADTLELLTPVFALGGAEHVTTSVTVVIHEIAEETISVELMILKGNFEELDVGNARKWSISDWNPGEVCPKCSVPVREISLPVVKSDCETTLAVCREHRGIWISDGDLKMNHIIPVTSFLSELDRQMALQGVKRGYRSPGQIFNELESYSDTEFVRAFVLYNKFWRKMDIKDIAFEPAVNRSFASRLVSRLVRKGRGKH
ncbi:MAG: hypothetical protein M1469_11095 [Bacteroidetes bacterium]|nr:hypothetical protein [Bacteroidota bacterium]